MIDFCFDLESFGSGLSARVDWMLNYSGRKFLETGSHTALAVSSLPFIISQLVPVLRVRQEQNVPACFKCVGREEITLH